MVSTDDLGLRGFYGFATLLAAFVTAVFAMWLTGGFQSNLAFGLTLRFLTMFAPFSYTTPEIPRVTAALLNIGFLSIVAFVIGVLSGNPVRRLRLASLVVPVIVAAGTIANVILNAVGYRYYLLIEF
jgi:hypothetical protein